VKRDRFFQIADGLVVELALKRPAAEFRGISFVPQPFLMKELVGLFD
jgi:hypothetical protein